MKKTELQTMVVKELKALAKKMSLKMPAGAKKSDLVESLYAAFTQKEVKSPTATPGAAKSTRATARRAAPAARRVSAPEKMTRKPARIPAAKPDVEKPSSGREWKLPPGTEEPLMAQERVSEAKYYTGPEKERYPYRELPTGYGEEKIALMVRDPYLAYAYWEVTRSRIEREKAWFGLAGRLTVRIYDVTGVVFDGRNAVGYFDQEVEELAGNWYFDLGRPAHSFIADIGLLSPEGRFLTLARSNYVMMPRDAVSDVVDEKWMLVDEEFWKLYGFPGGPSSPHLEEMMRARRMPQISSPGALSRPKRK